MAETAEARLARLLMRSRRRGTREMDLILGAFAARELPTMGEADLALYERMLEESDPDLLDWITGRRPMPERFASLLGRVQAGAVGLARD
jgi:antitoxin CptB